VIITLNGKETRVPEGTSLAALVERAGHHAGRRGIAIARNGEVVPRSRWSQQDVAAGDTVELLTASQGG
jgi:sulfur carrier protein